VGYIAPLGASTVQANPAAVAARDVLWRILNKVRGLSLSWSNYTFGFSDTSSDHPVLFTADNESGGKTTYIQWGPFGEHQTAKSAWSTGASAIGRPDWKFPLSAGSGRTLSQAASDLAAMVEQLPSSMPSTFVIPTWAKIVIGALGLGLVSSLAFHVPRGKKSKQRRRRRARPTRRRSYRRRASRRRGRRR
jgi:hypothetical protein